MPTRPANPCSHTGCPNRIPCPVHSSSHLHGSMTLRLTGRPWQRIRAAVLIDANYRCRLCAQHATVIDHITPLWQGGTDAWDNLQPLCVSCHNAKTRSDQTIPPVVRPAVEEAVKMVIRQYAPALRDLEEL